MKKAMILAVGTGTGAEANIVKPLIKTVRNSRPDYVGFLVSEGPDGSRPNADSIIQELNLENYEIISLPNPDELDQIFKESNNLTRNIMARGFECSDISVDFTSGTKAMTSGLVLSAVANNCGELKYITGERKDGIVIEGTEKILTISPSAILAHHDIKIGMRLMRLYRFDTALDLFKGINTALLDEHDAGLVKNLKHIASAYGHWDKFNHYSFLGESGKASYGQAELKMFKIQKTTDRRLRTIGENLKKGFISEDVLADLFNNASRRTEEGKYDDAVSRLYRLVEMLAQWVLAKDYGLSTSDIDLEKVPPEMHGELENNRDKSDSTIKIGLEKSYRLLEALGSELGQAFFKNKVRGKIKIRNESILAHGTQPIIEKDCRSLLNLTHQFLNEFVSDFKNRVEELRFPWTGDMMAPIDGPS